MPRWYFEDESRVALLRQRAHELKDTPFRAFSNAPGPGGGMDCVAFAEALHVAPGTVEPFTFPRSSKDYSRHVHNDKILNTLRGLVDSHESRLLSATFAELPLSDLRPPISDLMAGDLMAGDVVVMKTGRGQWHLPVMLDARTFAQCAYPDGVSEADITQPDYADAVVAVFRARAR
jgi:hypothetical protein